MFKRKFIIELDTIPETNEDICLAVAEYCATYNLPFEFIKRTHPLITIIDGRKYKITKCFTKVHRINLWVLRCEEIKI
ncbi:MAG: DUF4318 domain-containing protein [Lachnospiraceae bacterium]|nr:DUF4318 domain-containing protein [Lachnospiraceae bacterium]